MKKLNKGFLFRRKIVPEQSEGFTLIELLVVVTILAVLSLAGIAAFRNSAGNARDAKRKADVEAIVKALEGQFNPDTSQYPSSVDDAYFTSGKKPRTPDDKDYSVTFSPQTNSTSFQVCATLENPVNGSTQFCKNSSQGKYP